MQDVELSKVISPEGLIPCAYCKYIPKVNVYACRLNGQDAYRIMCRCQRGTYASTDKERVIAAWNGGQDYEGYEWVREFAQGCYEEMYPKEPGFWQCRLGLKGIEKFKKP